jgi:hypothetical protein
LQAKTENADRYGKDMDWKMRKGRRERQPFHEGSININKGLYRVKDLGESLTHPYHIVSDDKKQLKKYKEKVK